jgi:hypothetical protein
MEMEESESLSSVYKQLYGQCYLRVKCYGISAEDLLILKVLVFSFF